MSVSVRPLLAPGVAMVTAGAIALAPAVVAPPSQITAAPTVHVENIALTGIGQDIYYAITPWVQYGVSLAQYGVSFVPFIGPPIADQIGINYFAGIQPVVEATVNYAAGVVHNPLAFFPITAAYGNTLFGIGYNYVSAQLSFFGLPPLPPIVAATRAAASPAKAAASGPADIPAAVKSVVSARVQAGAEVRAAVRPPATRCARRSRAPCPRCGRLRPPERPPRSATPRSRPAARSAARSRAPAARSAAPSRRPAARCARPPRRPTTR